MTRIMTDGVSGELLAVEGREAIPKTTQVRLNTGEIVTFNYQQTGQLFTPAGGPGTRTDLQFQTEEILHPGLYQMTLVGTPSTSIVYEAARVPNR